MVAENFFDADLRVARIVDVEEFPKARRPAWKLTLDVGEVGQLKSSAQITNYTAEELRGRLVVAVVNLGPKQIADFISQCLVLAAIDEHGKPRLLGVDGGAKPGDRVR